MLTYLLVVYTLLLQPLSRFGLAAAHAAVVVKVDNLFDNSSIAISNCNNTISTKGKCNLRSSWLTCRSKAANDACVIILPRNSVILVNTSIGGFPLYSGMDVSIIGRNSTIKAIVLVIQPTGQPTEKLTGEPTVQPTVPPTGQPTGKPTGQPAGQPTEQLTGQPSGQFMTDEHLVGNYFIVSHSSDSSNILLNISDVTIQEFGSRYTDGGAIHLVGNVSVILRNVSFMSNQGRRGGAIYIR
jgi:hypothetical protein